MAAHNFKDLSNEPPFGRLTVIERGPNSPEGRAQWWCLCDCGTKILTKGKYLLNGDTQSCGCWCKDRIKEANSRHKRYDTPEWYAWSRMRQRCTNPRHPHFHYYGGRGITVCDRWLKSFAAFLEDMGPQPGPRYSIDRYPDQNGPYAPHNTRWTTHTQQVRNRRNTVYVVYHGIRMPLAEAAERDGITYKRAYYLYYEYGWPQPSAQRKVH